MCHLYNLNIRQVTPKANTGGDDIEECHLCTSDRNFPPSVTFYPRKVKKNAQREEVVRVCVLECQHDGTSHYLLVQRPEEASAFHTHSTPFLIGP